MENFSDVEEEVLVSAAEEVADKVVNYSIASNEPRKVMIFTTPDEYPAHLYVQKIRDKISAAGDQSIIIPNHTLRNILLSNDPNKKQKLEEFGNQLFEVAKKSTHQVNVHSEWLDDLPTEMMMLLRNSREKAIQHIRTNIEGNVFMPQTIHKHLESVRFDYEQLNKNLRGLQELFRQGRFIKVKGPYGTELDLSIEGIGATKCIGKKNIPGGEVFTCPVAHSVNGEIIIPYPAKYHGTTFEWMRFKFKDGKVVEFDTPHHKDELGEILATDENASGIGEFACGLNPGEKDISEHVIYNEKILGTLHIALGSSFPKPKEVFNGKLSKIHWDVVFGGEGYQVYVFINDNWQLIHKDGYFTPPEMEKLNTGEVIIKPRYSEEIVIPSAATVSAINKQQTVCV